MRGAGGRLENRKDRFYYRTSRNCKMLVVPRIRVLAGHTHLDFLKKRGLGLNKQRT